LVPREAKGLSTKRKKLATAGAVVAAVLAYMAYVGASADWQYYLTAEECLARGAETAGRRVRVSGTIVAGTLRVSDDRRETSFRLTGQDRDLPVVCSCPAPDNMSESKEVVVEGRMAVPEGVFRGDKIITRCASKYKTSPAKEPS
jgi:cytochrome c-type biogenesis protein CcmE